MTKTRILPLCLLLGLAACARSEDASLVPPTGNQGYNEIGRVGNPKADDREPAIGQWAQSLQENAQVLAFGPLGTEPLFSLACTGNRSVLLHRLNLLGISWGEIGQARGKGTFKEAWRLQWQPEFAVAVIEAGSWGNTVRDAAAAERIAGP